MKRTRTYVVMFLLIVIIAFHAIVNLVWLKQDMQPTGCDSVWHLVEAINFHISFQNNLQYAPSFIKAVTHLAHLFRTWHYETWPPFVYLVSAIIIPGVVTVFKIRWAVNMLFFAGLSISIYFSGKKMFSAGSGLVAAIVISLMPGVYGYSRQFGLDFPLLSLLSICFCFLLYSNKFSHLWYSLLFGISAGVACLIKLQALVFILPLMVYALFLTVPYDEKNVTAERLSTVLVVCASMFLIASLYWIDKGALIYSDFFANAFSSYTFYAGPRAAALGEYEFPLLSAGNIFFYAVQIMHIVSVPFFILFAISLCALIAKNRKHGFLIVFACIVPYLFFTVVSVKWERYILPLALYAALAIGWYCMQQKRRLIRNGLIAFVVVYGIVLNTLSSWVYPYSSMSLVYLPVFKSNFAVSFPPQKHETFKTADFTPLIHDIRAELKKNVPVTINFTDQTEAFVLPVFNALYAAFRGEFSEKKIIFDQADITSYKTTYLLAKKNEVEMKNVLAGDYAIFLSFKASDEYVVLKLGKDNSRD